MAANNRQRVYGELGTLYARCGGIFGVSAFVDRCMDKWMADQLLNSNQQVVQWHQKAQRCGFKFLVVQIVGQLTGGPQQYTGRPMDEAHKHLNIVGREWERFMEILNETCNEFQLSDDVTMDLNVLMISMEDECVIQPGEHVPANPGPARPRGSSFYARCGGVYPLALFVDRLVDALLDDERVQIPVDGQKRTDVSLKYLLTEVVCNISGGPEVITAREFEETKLLLPNAAWEIFIATAQVAADHLPPGLRAELVVKLQSSKTLIVDAENNEPLPSREVGPSGGARGAVVKDARAAAAGKMLTSAAIAARHADPGAHVAARRRVLGDPRTLYGRAGGVFGLAKLSNALMDMWMQDANLNANAAVAKWHESQQKFGFKFLVTQLLGYLTGGPQRYTGQAMETAHKHLGITNAQWQSFVDDASQVFDEMHVDEDSQAELHAIIANLKRQCVVKPGETVPADPGMCRARPSGSTAYAQLGGVYPIAMFADRVVEALLKGDRVPIEWHELEDRTGNRHPPGLKYMFTELLCHSAGGPEVVTSKGYDEAKLAVDPEHWPAFLDLVTDVARMWPTRHHIELILRICESSKVEICTGLGGRPDIVAGVQELNATAISASGCPFSGGSNVGARCPVTGAPGRCPFNATTPSRSASVPSGDIASPTSVASTTGSRSNTTVMAGRVLGSSLQQKLDELLDEDPDVCCPVSLMVFSEPVIASDSFVYDKVSLMQLLSNKLSSPMTREKLQNSYREAQAKQVEVQKFLEQRSPQLLLFARTAAPSNEDLAVTALDRLSDYLEKLRSASALQLAKDAAQLYASMGRTPPEGLARRASESPQSEAVGSWFSRAMNFVIQ
jgi:hemoglobin